MYGLHILKFSLHLLGYLPKEQNFKREIIYPVICFINPETNIVENRFKKVKGYISIGNSGFYVKKIEEVKKNQKHYSGLNR